MTEWVRPDAHRPPGRTVLERRRGTANHGRKRIEWRRLRHHWAIAPLAVSILLPAVRAESKSIVGDEAAFREAESAWKSCFSSLTRAPSFPSRPDPDDHGAT